MEIGGLALGAVGLLALYETAASRVRSVKRFSSESLRLTSRYNATKILFERWGKQVGIANNDALEQALHPQLKDKATASAVAGLLESINDVFLRADSAIARYHDQKPPVLSAADHPDEARLNLRLRLKWAVADSKRLFSQVQDFDDIVQKLYLLVPLENLHHDQFQQLQDALVQSQRTDALNRATHWLDATSTENSLDAYCSARLDATCNWVDIHPAYQDWNSEDLVKLSKVLWVRGPAGFGKSVLCAYIIKSLLAKKNCPVYYFFCSGDSEAQRNPSSILRAWIHQAIHHDDTALDMVLQHLESCQNTKATHSDLWKLLKELMSHSGANAVFCVDGLDECPRSTNRIDLHRSRGDTLNELLKVAAETQARLLVVSRNEGDIRAQLRPHGPQIPGINLYELSVTKDFVSTDVARFAEHVVTKKLPDKPAQFHKDLAAQMAEKGDGMFLWIRLQSQSLRPRKGKRQLQRTVDEMPTDLIQIYERNWNDIQSLSRSDRQRAEMILRWITFARRPLTIAELSEIVAVLESDEDGGLAFDELPSPFDEDYVDSEILGLCGSFLEFRTTGPFTSWELQTVHLVHYSCVEFLSGSHDDAPFSDHLLQNHYSALDCLKYIDHEDTWQDYKDDCGVIYKRPFLMYAIYEWHKHLEASQQYQHKLQPQVLSLFGLSNPNWDHWRWKYEGFYGTSDAPPLGPGGRMYYAACFGLQELVQFLYSKGIGDVNEIGGYYGNPVQAATAGGHLDTLRLLLHLGGCVHIKGGYRSALHTAAACNQETAAIELLKHGAALELTDDDCNTPLLIAVLKVNYTITQLLVNQGADLCAHDNDGWNSLHHAAHSGNIKIVNLLLQNGADFSSTTTDGRTPLILATYGNNVNIVQALLDAGADIAAPDLEGYTALHHAAMKGHTKVVSILLDAGADLAASIIEGYTALHLAAMGGNTKVVSILLDAGADVAAPDPDGYTALHYAAVSSHTEVVSILLDAGADVAAPNPNRHTALQFAAIRGHTKVVSILLDAGVDLAASTIEGYTALHLAAMKGQTKIISILLDAGADVAAPDTDGYTALHLAAMKGQTKIITILLDAGADVAAPDLKGYTALHLAAVNSHTEVVSILLAAGADVAAPDLKGYTALHLAAMKGQTKIISILLDAGADVAAPYPYGHTALHHAAIMGQTKVISILLDAGADVAAPYPDGHTALHHAARMGQTKVISILLDAGADLAASTTIEGYTVLHYAAFYGHTEVVSILLDAGADVAAPDLGGYTALHHAAMEGQTKAVSILLDAGADLAASTIEGDTALHLAAFYGHTEVVSILLDAGADVAAPDLEGYTALHHAATGGHTKVVQQLIRAGTDVDLAAHDGTTPLHGAFRARQEATAQVLLENHASLHVLDFSGVAPWEYTGEDFRAKIPQCKGCEAPTTYDRQQRVRQSVRVIAGMAKPAKMKKLAFLSSLGRCLLLLQDLASASVVYNQSVGINSEDGNYIHHAFCDGCDSRILGIRYTCRTCRDFDLCTSCMKQYAEDGRLDDCAGHEYLRVPSDDWNRDDQTDVYTEEFVDWLKELAVRHELDGL